MEEKTIAKLTQNITQNRRKNKKFSVGFAFLFCVCFAMLPQTARAATMYLSPSVGSYDVGKTFSVGIYVSSADQAMNAASASINFPTEKLEVVSLSKGSSIISLWVQDPSFSNSSGIINLEGIVLNPGFTGSSGNIITINFKGKAAGTANVRFSSGSVLANDGQGTNVLNSLGNAEFTLGAVATPAPSAPSAPTAPTAAGVPQPPKISSLTHPDSTKWYNSNDADFTWTIGSNITGVNILADQDPGVDIGSKSDGKISSYSYNNLDDGEWYFLIELRNFLGWGPTGRFQFNIDTVNPENLQISVPEDRDPANPKVIFKLSADDNTAGIDHFEIQLDDEKEISLAANIFEYETPFLEPGNHILTAKAFDKAGNFITDSVEFAVEKLQPPTFTDYPEFLKVGQVLVLDGKTYPNSTVNLWLQKDKGDMFKFEVRSGDNGNFRFIPGEQMEEGVYKIQAEVVNKWEAKSKLSDQITIVVERSTFVRIGALLITLFSLLMPIIGLILLILFILWYLWHRFKKFRKKLHNEINHAETSLHKAFDKLRKNVGRQIYLLEKAQTKRELTVEEKHLIRQLKKDLDDAEKAIIKEIRAIEK